MNCGFWTKGKWMIGWEEKTLDDEKADHSYRPENGRDVICGHCRWKGGRSYHLHLKSESVPFLLKRSRPKVLISDLSDHFWIIISWGPDQNHQPGYHLVLKEGLKLFAAGTNIICLPSISGSYNNKKYVRVPFKPLKSASKDCLVYKLLWCTSNGIMRRH